ncbi:MAG: YggS family pyridoxal phosphate-dependent enzyme, partial [Flavobacteriia bacterium]|nr:YggS family pyridoxal phosphate-dependent enzyme [Candidatus Bostrichicola ureolyticus]
MNVGNLFKIKSNIPSYVKIIAVSKNQPISKIKEIYDAGQRDFGENYINELVEKHKSLPKDIRWHMIGKLQSNKIKYIGNFV